MGIITKLLEGSRHEPISISCQSLFHDMAGGPCNLRFWVEVSRWFCEYPIVGGWLNLWDGCQYFC